MSKAYRIARTAIPDTDKRCRPTWGSCRAARQIDASWKPRKRTHRAYAQRLGIDPKTDAMRGYLSMSIRRKRGKRALKPAEMVPIAVFVVHICHMDTGEHRTVEVKAQGSENAAGIVRRSNEGWRIEYID